jgi:hypothetical protein
MTTLSRLFVGNWARICAVPLLGGALSCGGSGVVREAEAGRFVGLDQRVVADLSRGAIGHGDALDIARATARGEAERASGARGLALVRELAICARQVESALSRRAETEDDIGAEAMMILLEAGLESPGGLTRWVSSGSAAWRAVGARALVDEDDGSVRRARMVDGDQDVRLAALRAAAFAADPADLDVLLEAARLDPFPLARSQAIRSAGVIGGDRVVLALRDLWPHVDESARRAIADAWAFPNSLEAGGRRELEWAMDSQRGIPGIAAAWALLRVGGPGSVEALSALERAIEQGPAKDRIFAMLVAPYSSARIRDAVKKASEDKDEVVALAALSRRLEEGGPKAADRSMLVKKMMPIAMGSTPRALLAKDALARAGVREVVPILAGDTRSKDARVREAAGRALSVLHEFPRAAVVAVDAKPEVRTGVACAILREEAK